MDITRDDIGSGISTFNNHQRLAKPQLLIASLKEEGKSPNHREAEDVDENTASTFHILKINDIKTSTLTKENNFQGGITIALELL